MHHARFLIDPAICIESFLFLQELVFQFIALVGLKTRHRKLVGLPRRCLARISGGRSRHGRGLRLMSLLVGVQIPVHADQNEVNEESDYSQPDQEGKNTGRTEVFALEFNPSMIEVLVIHGAPAPIQAVSGRRTPAAKAAVSDGGKTAPARILPWQRERPVRAN